MSAIGEHQKLFNGPLVDGLPSIIAAAHELKSPLALIRQLSLMLESGELPSSEHDKVLKQINLTTERALRLTSDLTKSAKLSDALFALEPINPQQLCQDIVSELKPLFQAHDRELELTTRKHPLLLVANRDLLRRIIVNFSDNALHYTDDNSRVEISVGLRSKGQTIRLGVRDHGPALSADTLKSLKNKINDVSVTTVHARPNSSGLGLYIASQFASAMNGEIGFTRHRDGSTFYVDLQASKQLSLL